MHTKCPDCDTAFRVTVPDLQRASGRVVCIGCGREFNALESLSEDPPEAAQHSDDKSILESLEELTGPHEIRIEDTGVEWRVIEEDELEDDDPEPGSDAEDAASSVPWYVADVEVTERGPEPGDNITGTAPPGPADSIAGQPVERTSQQESLQLPAVVDAADLQRYDDNTPLPDDFADESEPRMPQRRAEDRIEPRSPEADEAQVDLALGEPDDWMELLEEVGPPPPADDALDETDVLLMTEDDEAPVRDSYPSDIDTQFDLQAIELGIELTGSRTVPSGNGGQATAGSPREISRDGPRATESAEELTLVEECEPGTGDAAPLHEGGIGPAHRAGRHGVGPGSAFDEWQGSAIHGPRAIAEDPEDPGQRHREEAFEQELATAYSVAVDDEGTDPSGEPAQAGHVAPPSTEDELTTNMLIDRDLIRVAEQHGVFGSANPGRRAEDMPHIETIIMEGDFVQNVVDGDFFDSGAGRIPSASGSAADARKALTGEDDVLFGTSARDGQRVRGGRRRIDPPSYAIMAGVAALGLMLAAQVVHAYRETLAKYEIFDRTVGSVYRILGEPVIPEWSVKEWRFEATSGSTDESDAILTISSRLANSSDTPLPYPLIHVSLTDRWEEIIGSKVLEPAEYLGDADPAGRVDPEENFTALIRVEEPAPEATGFKLNVCYPDTGGRVRCATEDFRN